MKLGIVGTGMIVNTVLTELGNLPFKKLYIYGRNKEKAQLLCRQYHLDDYTSDYAQLLQMDIDTVYIALPNTLHFSFAYQALECGKHVIIEKPITISSAELAQLISLAKAKQLLLLEAMNIHSLPAYRKLQDALPAIGNVKIVSLNYSQYSSRYDAFLSGIILPAFDRTLGGGALMDLNIYNIHGVVGLFGKPKSVHYFPNMKHNIDTSGILTMQYPDFQAVCIGAKDCKAPAMLTIQGDKGVICIKEPINQMTGFEVILNDGRIEKTEFHEKKHRLYYEFMDFIQIIDQKDFARADARLRLSEYALYTLDQANTFIPYTNA